MQSLPDSLKNTDSQPLLLRLVPLSKASDFQVSQVSRSTPTHFYFLPAAVPLNTKAITGTNKLNSFQAGSLVNAAALALLAWFPNWHSVPRDLVSEAQRCDQNLVLKALGPEVWRKHLLPGTAGAEGSRGQGVGPGPWCGAGSPGCCTASFSSKCNKSNKVSLLPLAQADSKDTHCRRGRSPRTNGLSILPARGVQEVLSAPRQGGPFSTATAARTRPALTGHLQSGLIAGGARRGSDPARGGRRGRRSGKGKPELRDAELGTPAPAPHALARLPALTLPLPVPPAPQYRNSASTLAFPKLWGLLALEPGATGTIRGSRRRHRNSGSRTVAAKAVAAAAAAATATASARVNAAPWRCKDALSPRLPAGPLRRKRPSYGSEKVV